MCAYARTHAGIREPGEGAGIIVDNWPPHWSAETETPAVNC